MNGADIKTYMKGLKSIHAGISDVLNTAVRKQYETELETAQKEENRGLFSQKKKATDEERVAAEKEVKKKIIQGDKPLHTIQVLFHVLGEVSNGYGDDSEIMVANEAEKKAILGLLSPGGVEALEGLLQESSVYKSAEKYQTEAIETRFTKAKAIFNALPPQTVAKLKEGISFQGEKEALER